MLESVVAPVETLSISATQVRPSQTRKQAQADALNDEVPKHRAARCRRRSNALVCVEAPIACDKGVRV